MEILQNSKEKHAVQVEARRLRKKSDSFDIMLLTVVWDGIVEIFVKISNYNLQNKDLNLAVCRKQL